MHEPTTLDELDAKALDWASQLHERYEAGLITGHAFHVAVETMWACLGGVLDTEVFSTVMRECNQSMETVPNGPTLALVRANGKAFLWERAGCVLSVRDAKPDALHSVTYLTEDIAAAKMKALTGC